MYETTIKLTEYKNYIQALMWYREFGNSFNDKNYIDTFKKPKVKRYKILSGSDE